jgi:transcriptional regulator with XRE-family HTH domain
LTQEVLARRAHVTAKFISEIENGHASPTVDTLARIVEGLGLPLSAFFAADPGGVRDDLATLRALFGGQSATVRRRALRILKALCEE